MKVNWNKQQAKPADKTELGIIRVNGNKKSIDIFVNGEVSGKIEITTEDKVLEERFLNVVKLLNS